MDTDRSLAALLQFLDYLAEKGMMAKATALARKAAASQILSILNASEASDVTIIDLDDVVTRFGHLHGRKYNTQSLVTYKSRLRAALGDFRSYLSNPLAFRPSIQNRDRSSARVIKARPDSAKSEDRPETPRSAPAPIVAAANILPIPIRSDLTVYIQGLPFDLKDGEAKKIAAVVTAMVHG